MKTSTKEICLLYNLDEETPLSIQGPLVRVDLVNIGEGLQGDYNPEDPEDENLLRFDVYVKNDSGDWEEVEDASYCTNISADASIAGLESAIKSIYSRYADAITSYPVEISVKKLGEELSWISRESDKSQTLPLDISIDMWYGDPITSADQVTTGFSDRDCLYRGNIYIDEKIVGDFETSCSTSIEKAFPQLTFVPQLTLDWDKNNENEVKDIERE